MLPRGSIRGAMSLTSLRSSQALMNAAVAGSLAALIAWFGPPGTDFAAHVFQLHVYLQHGFALWTNYWYAGRYTFVGYSVLYYPLAAVAGIRLLAVLSVAASTAAFTLVIRQTWGESTVWATRFFALVAAASVVSAAFPYGLGLALALTALVALARRRLAIFGVLAALTPRREPARVPVPAPRAGGRRGHTLARTRRRSRPRSPRRSARSGCSSGGSSPTTGSTRSRPASCWPRSPSAGSAPGSPGGSRRRGSCTRSSSPMPPPACSPT